MMAARHPRASAEVRMSVVDPRSGRVALTGLTALPQWLRPGDLVVLNDAATLPAAIAVRGGGAAMELRLAGFSGREDGWWAVLFGPGSWRDDTDTRPPPAPLPVGTRLDVDPELHFEIVAVSPRSPRLVQLRPSVVGPALWARLYSHGAPVQYSYLDRALHLADIQTPFACRPWAAEAPSAGRPLDHGVLAALRQRGVHIAHLTHAAGLSATGDPALDALLPLPEHFDIPAATVHAVRRAGRVIAAGTTVVRALEGAAAQGGLRPGRGTTDLVLDPGVPLRVVHGVLSGQHAPGESHHRLLRAFADADLLARAHAQATAAGFVAHEFGDAMLVLPDALPAPARARPARLGHTRPSPR